MDITTITNLAKERLLEDGEYHPMLYVETGDRELYMIAFADFPYETTFEKQKAFFGLGYKLGKENPGKELHQVCFVCEAWVSRQKLGEPRKYAAPSQDPNRGEALVVQILTIDPAPEKSQVKETARIMDLIRYQGGVDLLARDEGIEAHGKLLPSFLAGFSGGQMPDEQFRIILKKYIG